MVIYHFYCKWSQREGSQRVNEIKDTILICKYRIFHGRNCLKAEYYSFFNPKTVPKQNSGEKCRSNTKVTKMVLKMGGKGIRLQWQGNKRTHTRMHASTEMIASRKLASGRRAAATSPDWDHLQASSVILKPNYMENFPYTTYQGREDLQ